MPSDAIVQPVTAELTGREARWERHNSERQKRILTSAVELIEERAAGAEVSVQQIADRAGLAKSVVYRQFSGRDDLDRRVRAFVLGQFAAALDASMSISVGTLDQILTRTISAVAEWITEHPRIHEFMGTGPTDYDDESIDAISSLKATIADSALTTITEVGRSVGIDSSPFDSLPFAVVTMVEGTLTHWVRSTDPKPSREEIVADLAKYTWYMFDGVARSSGLQIDPHVELSTLIAELVSSDGGTSQPD